MIIGCPKEIKSSESRVALTPVGVRELSKHGFDHLSGHLKLENAQYAKAGYCTAARKTARPANRKNAPFSATSALKLP